MQHGAIAEDEAVGGLQPQLELRASYRAVQLREGVARVVGQGRALGEQRTKYCAL